MRETIFCNHYRAMTENTTCSVGVEYDKFKGVPFDKRPCFCKQGKPPPPGCLLAEFPTPEQLAEEEKEFQQRFENVSKARGAILDSLGSERTFKRGVSVGTSGTIDCPVCSGSMTLRFSRSGYNGHIHAACKTEGCVSWME